MPDLPDHSGSRAILIGTATYQDPGYPPLPAAANSLAGMRQILTDPALCGWPDERVTVLEDPRDMRRLVQTLRSQARRTDGVLLIYFVGHGTILRRGQLCLTLSDTDSEHADITGVEYDRVREVLKDSPARLKVVILDCCYSGRAIEALSATVADGTDTHGAYTLTASDRAAHVPPLDQQEHATTSFTGELLELVRGGIPGGPERLTLGTLYPHLRRRLELRGLPAPNQRGTDTADRFPFTRNAAHRREPPVRARPGDAHSREPQPPPAVPPPAAAPPTPHPDPDPPTPTPDPPTPTPHPVPPSPDPVPVPPSRSSPSPPPDRRGQVREYAAEAGPARLIETPPAFADERYRMLSRAAGTGDLEAALRLADISRRHGHLEGEACWLALATRQGHHEALLPLARVYRRAGLLAEARARTVAACGYGDDEAVREVLGYPPDALEDAVHAGAPSGRDFHAVLISAAEHGSTTARYELGLRAAGAGDLAGAATFLKQPAAAGNVHAMYVLGGALLDLGERRAGRHWLHMAGRAGHVPARLLHARTALGRRPLQRLAQELVAGFGSEHFGRGHFGTGHLGDEDPAALMVEVAWHCRARALTRTAMACLECAASAGDGGAMVRLARLHVDRGDLGEAGRWLDRARHSGVTDAALREPMFTLACRLSWDGDEEAGRRRLAEAANAGHAQAIKILAGLSAPPSRPALRMPRSWFPRNLLFSLGVLVDIGTDRRLARLFNRCTTTAGVLFMLGGAALVGLGLVAAFQGRGAAATYGIVGMAMTPPGIALAAWRIGRNPPRRRRSASAPPPAD